MRIAFYAPMKHPQHPNASGDREIARLLIAALELAGHTVDIVSDYRSWQKEPILNNNQQNAIAAEQQRLRTLFNEAQGDGEAFAGWFTYHLYHKAEDHFGPIISAEFAIPYFIAEASIADKHRNGSWQDAYHRTLTAIQQASAVILLNPRDRLGLQRHINEQKIKPLAVFSDTPLAIEPLLDSSTTKAPLRLLTVAMMRDDAKLRSYNVLLDALNRLPAKHFTLDIIGAGVMQDDLQRRFGEQCPITVCFHGELPKKQVYELMSQHDLLVWPAINEALGMVFVEAHCRGLPVVAGYGEGVASIVQHDSSGWLIGAVNTLQPDNAQALPAAALSAADFAQLLSDKLLELSTQPTTLTRWQQGALQRAQSHFTMQRASEDLNQILLDHL